jgi:hypothetical protein
MPEEKKHPLTENASIDIGMKNTRERALRPNGGRVDIQVKAETKEIES